jgi:hypothetical protein
MQIQRLIAAAVFGLAASTGAQAQVTVFNTAFLEPLPPISGEVGGITLNGFGRNTSTLRADTLGAPVPLVPYFDTWNIGTSAVAPGVYNFSSLTVEAAAGTIFSGITFNSFDAEGVRTTILFSLNGNGTSAVGSGNFTVLAECPVDNCVWIDVIGLRPVGQPWGYGGGGTALPIPEPGTWALLALGLAGVAAAARRKRRETA